MKNILLVFILIICLSTKSQAQDTLSMRSGENLMVKIIEVGTSEIKYKKMDNLNGPIFAILKSDLLYIKYENGIKEDYSSIPKVEKNPDMFVKGQNDAIIYYQGYKTASTGTLVTTALPGYGLFFGMIPAGMCATAAPLDENLGYPDINLMKNEQYAAGYKQKAKQIKSSKVIKNYLSGAKVQAGYFIAFMLALALTTTH